MGTRYNWAGDVILRDTIMWNKRAVLGYQNVTIPTDIREWLSSSNSEVIRRAVQDLNLPTARTAKSFDLRCWTLWKYVVDTVDYLEDKDTVGLPDFWFFPPETLALRKGDCEDSSFLLASLMLAAGISEQCLRVVLGRVVASNKAFGHAWVVYQNEEGKWCLLETTLQSVPSRLPLADPFTDGGVAERYEPSFCLNSTHLWSIYPVTMQVAHYIKLREEGRGFKAGNSGVY